MRNEVFKSKKGKSEYCGSSWDTHAGIPTDREMIFGKNTVKERKKMAFKHTGRFIPDRLKSDSKSTFSRLVILPQVFKSKTPK